MLQAVAEVHANGICLLDIKPANVWASAVQSPEEQPRVCLLDFGMAHEFVPGTFSPSPVSRLVHSGRHSCLAATQLHSFQREISSSSNNHIKTILVCVVPKHLFLLSGVLLL